MQESKAIQIIPNTPLLPNKKVNKSRISGLIDKFETKYKSNGKAVKSQMDFKTFETTSSSLTIVSQHSNFQDLEDIIEEPLVLFKRLYGLCLVQDT